MGRIEQVESTRMNTYNRILTSGVRTGVAHDYCWRDYETVGFIEGNVSEETGTRRITADELERGITARFGEGDYIYAACESKRRKGQYLVMRLLKKKGE